MKDRGSGVTEVIKVFFLTHSTSWLYESASVTANRTTGAIFNRKGLNVENLFFRKLLEGLEEQAIGWAPRAFWTMQYSVSSWPGEGAEVQDLASCCMHWPRRR